MTTATVVKTYSMFVQGTLSPVVNPLDEAKWQIVRAMSRIGWEGNREWQSFTMSEKFTEPSNGFMHTRMDLLRDRLRGHYIRQGKRPQIRWQGSPDGEFILFIKLDV